MTLNALEKRQDQHRFVISVHLLYTGFAITRFECTVIYVVLLIINNIKLCPRNYFIYFLLLTCLVLNRYASWFIGAISTMSFYEQWRQLTWVPGAWAHPIIFNHSIPILDLEKCFITVNKNCLQKSLLFKLLLNVPFIFKNTYIWSIFILDSFVYCKYLFFLVVNYHI